MFLTVCDLCKKQIKDNKIHISLDGDIRFWKRKDICKKCWQDKNNWPKIHSLSSRKDKAI
jgi:hypothetical protein